MVLTVGTADGYVHTKLPPDRSPGNREPDHVQQRRDQAPRVGEGRAARLGRLHRYVGHRRGDAVI